MDVRDFLPPPTVGALAANVSEQDSVSESQPPEQQQELQSRRRVQAATEGTQATEGTSSEASNPGRSLGPSESVIIHAILIRASFGGMPGDIMMLKRYANLW